jgi:hypothetical protein
MRLVVDDNSRISLSNNDSGGTGGEDSTSGNTTFGYLAGQSIEAGCVNNTFIGHKVASGSLDDATNNVGIGVDALVGLTTGDYNIAIGYGSLATQTTGTQNVGVGYQSLGGDNDGTDSTAVGHKALLSLVGSTKNVAIGHQAMSLMNGTADGLANCVAIGADAFKGDATNTTTGANGTVAIGSSALTALTSGADNLAIGYGALAANTTALGNLAIGRNALNDLNHANSVRNMAIGAYAGDQMGTADGNLDNIFIGYSAGGGDWHASNATQYNVGIGNYVMDGDLDAALQNTGVGHNALTALTSGDQNTAIGRGALEACVTASQNVAVGVNALQNHNAAGSVAVGYGALNSANGSDNTAVGTQALWHHNAGSSNVAMGRRAGRYYGASTGALENVSSSTYIGYLTRANDNSMTNETVIGANAIGGGSYTVTIGSGGIRHLSIMLSMDDFTTVADNDAAYAPLLKIPQFGFLKRVTCTVRQANADGTGEYNISLGTAVEAAGDTVAGRVELIGADSTANSDFTGATYKASTKSADGDTQVNIETAKHVHIWEANQATDDSSGWTLFESADMYLYVCHANGSNAAADPTSGNAILEITASYWGID